MDSFEPHFHHLHIKANETARNDTRRPKDRTLFVLNVPPYIQKVNLRNAFEEAGALESIYLCEKPTGELPEVSEKSIYFTPAEIFGFKCAYIVFKTSRGLQNALQLTQVASGPIKCGLAKWCEEYLSRIPDPVKMQVEIDSYIANYDEKKQLAEEESKNQEPDDDGWVTVTKKSQGTEKKESIFNRIEEKEREKKGRKELKDFYRFQMKESKAKQLVQLRQRFEEDKKKVEILRNSKRRFKPF